MTGERLGLIGFSGFPPDRLRPGRPVPDDIPDATIWSVTGVKRLHDLLPMLVGSFHERYAGFFGLLFQR